MTQADWLWPGNKRVAVVFNVCLEAWSDGKAPGISPMGNPLRREGPVILDVTCHAHIFGRPHGAYY